MVWRTAQFDVPSPGVLRRRLRDGRLNRVSPDACNRRRACRRLSEHPCMDLAALCRALLHYVTPRGSGPIEVVRPAGAQPGAFAVGLVVTTFDRPAYLRETIAHLERAALGGMLVAVVDDASADPETLWLVRGLALRGAPVVKIFRQRRRGFGVHASLRLGWDSLADEYGCALLANLDADAIVKRDGLARLVALFRRERARCGPLIATGFNAASHDIEAEAADHVVKRSIGGIN